MSALTERAFQAVREARRTFYPGSKSCRPHFCSAKRPTYGVIASVPRPSEATCHSESEDRDASRIFDAESGEP